MLPAHEPDEDSELQVLPFSPLAPTPPAGAQTPNTRPTTPSAQLPRPVADLWDWQLDGACRGRSPDVFFHPDGERGPSRRNRDIAAKAVCLYCPVLKHCRKQALQAREPYGVWGGLTEYERDAM